MREARFTGMPRIDPARSACVFDKHCSSITAMPVKPNVCTQGSPDGGWPKGRQEDAALNPGARLQYDRLGNGRDKIEPMGALSAASAALLVLAFANAASAQFPGREMRDAVQLDLDGKGVEARRLFQKHIDDAGSPRAKAEARRAMAMSWAFEGNCSKTVEYEKMVIAYWNTQEKENPGSAFYQEGEMADEAARVCIDSGDLDTAAEWYRRGKDLGLKEPGISPDRQALWEFRWEHAQARICARRGQRSEAEQHVAAAQAAFNRMTQLRSQQEFFLPYLTGYVAFYLGDYAKALDDLRGASQNDPFIQCLLGQTYEKLARKEDAMECYGRAAATTAHNPPAAFARPFARRKLS
jgi:tetratricopeptide (TPR) repeat protein